MSAIRIEAESMTLSGYVAELNKSFASGKAIIGISSTATSGTATTVFTGTAGTYNLAVGYYDENDGNSPLTVLVDGVVIDSWTFNQQLGSNSASATTFATRQITGVNLNANSVIEIRGVVNSGERARIDYIELSPTSGGNTNVAPVAGADAYSTTQNTSLTVAVPGVLSNDSDTNGDTLSVANFTANSTAGGTVNIGTNGNFTYTPPTGFIGTDNFSYTVTDGRGGTDTETVTVTVNAGSTSNATTRLIAAKQLKGIGNSDTATFNVRYISDLKIDVSTLDSNDIRIIGPNGFEQTATLVSGNQKFTTNDSNVLYESVTYSIAPPGGGWAAANQGTYSVVLQNNQVRDGGGNFISGRTVGTFEIGVLPTTISGTGANDTLSGNTLDNTLNGLDGADTLRGGAGDNTLNGGNGLDTADYSQATRGVMANLATGKTLSPIFGTQSQPKIMPLGDSITAGQHSVDPVPGAYRIQLWQNFLSAGIPIDFVGSQSNGPAELGDKNHEGYPGANIRQIRRNLTERNLLEAAQPDAVLLMIGANNTGSTAVETIDEMLRELNSLINTIATRAPQAQIVVTSITPVTPSLRGDFRAQLIKDYNTLIPDLVADRAAEGKKVSFVNAGGQLGVSDMNQEGLHPTAAGYNKLGNAWFDEIIDEDTLNSIENLTGSAFADRLTGNAAANVINGGGGDDLIDGGADNDALTGGGGADRFVLRAGNGTDTITDFAIGNDRIALSGLTFSQLSLSGDSIFFNSETLARLTGINTATLTEASFVTV